MMVATISHLLPFKLFLLILMWLLFLLIASQRNHVDKKKQFFFYLFLQIDFEVLGTNSEVFGRRARKIA